MLDALIAFLYLAAHDVSQLFSELLHTINDPHVSAFHGFLAIVGLVVYGLAAVFSVIAVCLFLCSIPMLIIGASAGLWDGVAKLFKSGAR